MERTTAGFFSTEALHRYSRHPRKCLKDPWFIFDAVLVVRVPGAGGFVDFE